MYYTLALVDQIKLIWYTFPPLLLFTTRDAWISNFISIQFWFGFWKRLGFGSEWVWFGLKITLNASKVILSLLIWTADCTQFLLENHQHGCQIFGPFRFGLDFLNPNWISVYCTALFITIPSSIWEGHGRMVLNGMYGESQEENY